MELLKLSDGRYVNLSLAQMVEPAEAGVIVTWIGGSTTLFVGSDAALVLKATKLHSWNFDEISEMEEGFVE